MYTFVLQFAFVVSTFFSFQAIAAESAPKKEIAKVFAQTIATKQLSELYTYPARVLPKINSTVLSDSDGIVKKIFTPLGTKVKTGQHLAAIQHTDPVYQYAQATVRAPVSGVISSVVVREGTQVIKGAEILSITDPDQIRITVEIAAMDLNAIKAKTKGKFRASGMNIDIPVVVEGISPFVNPATGTATCELKTEKQNTNESENRLRPGLVGRVEFQANIREGLTVPDHALYYKDGATFLRVIGENDIAKNFPVQLGRKQSGEVEILSGIKSGDRIVVRTSRFIGDGEKVEIENNPAKPTEKI